MEVMAMLSLRPYEEMNPLEVITYWERLDIKAAHGNSIFRSKNRILWAIVDEAKMQTLLMWDVHTGYVYKEIDADTNKKHVIIKTGKVAEPVFNGYIPPTPEPMKTSICANCGHEIKWEPVAVPPRWEHVRVMARDNSSRLHWICECGCMTPEPKEAP